ncbi:uncharacterized protein [Musca autumnalis]|uniref:uncharacterized protein n=1 Tax=Musca autumnalis TaxID=221902 RepID=UPI003CFACD10
MRDLHKLIARLSNQNRNRDHIVKDKNGQPITQVEEQTHRWKQHFEFISNVNEDNLSNPEPLMEHHINNSISTETPNPNEIKQAILRLKRNKAPGEDGIPPELLQANPATSAEMLYPHIRNAWINEQLPNSWNKGLIIKLPKKNDLSECDNWRGIRQQMPPDNKQNILAEQNLKPSTIPDGK